MAQPAVVESNAAARVRELHEASLAPATRKQYEHGIVRLLKHFWGTRSELNVFTPSFEATVGDRAIDKQFVRHMLANASADHFPFGPLFTASAYELYLGGLVKDGDPNDPVSSASLSSHRSALNHLYSSFKRNQDPAFAASLKDLFKGSKRKHAERRATGEVKEEGKNALKFGLYCVLMKYLLTHYVTSDAIFFGLYICLCWNLMCRAGNAATIALQHMEWQMDSFTILFAHSKTDKEGAKQHPRNLYANPLKPEISVLVHLGIYWLTTGFEQGQVLLFPGASPKNRYAKCFIMFIGALRLAKDLVGEFISYLWDLACHSTRKGAASFAGSGTTRFAFFSEALCRFRQLTWKYSR
jgi:hypothetical protein